MESFKMSKFAEFITAEFKLLNSVPTVFSSLRSGFQNGSIRASLCIYTQASIFFNGYLSGLPVIFNQKRKTSRLYLAVVPCVAAATFIASGTCTYDSQKVSKYFFWNKIVRIFSLYSTVTFSSGANAATSTYFCNLNKVLECTAINHSRLASSQNCPLAKPVAVLPVTFSKIFPHSSMSVHTLIATSFS